MKVLVYMLLMMFGFYGCQKIEYVDPDDSSGSAFDQWSSQLSATNVEQMYKSGTVFMTDVRVNGYILPFRYEDKITVANDNSGLDYPYTRSEGITRLFYRAPSNIEYIIFENTWNFPPCAAARVKTDIRFGVTNGIECARISNYSFSPLNGGSYWRENRLFFLRNDTLRDVDLVNLDAYEELSDIRLTNRSNVLVIYTHQPTCASTQNVDKRFILYDLISEKHRSYSINL